MLLLLLQSNSNFLRGTFHHPARVYKSLMKAVLLRKNAADSRNGRTLLIEEKRSWHHRKFIASC